MINEPYKNNALYQSIDNLIKEIAEMNNLAANRKVSNPNPVESFAASGGEFDPNRLTLNLQAAQTEIGSLKSVIERMESEHLALTEKLEDAKNEIARLDMLRKRNWDDSEAIRRLAKPPSCSRG